MSDNKDIKKIRNFSIIAHIDHGKSTLADRMLELTGTVEKRKMKEQLLDGMDIERERGITIKLTPVNMQYQGYNLNLIDTPGHVDFSYEVSRSLAAVETALLLVDSTQGIQAQTLANLYLALDQDLTIIPIINKIDLPAADIVKTKNEIIKLIGCREEEIFATSGKTGEGVAQVLEEIIRRGGAPREPEFPVAHHYSRSLIFDSKYDTYRGVVAYIRVFNGTIKKGDKIKLVSVQAESEVLDCGIFNPGYVSTKELRSGQIGYVVTGFKQVADCRVGDTIISGSNISADENFEPLPGYHKVKPMVAGIFPKEGNDFKELREAMEKLKLNDSAYRMNRKDQTLLVLVFVVGF